MEIALSAGVHFCLAQGHGVFLDLKRDEYSAVRLEPAGIEVQTEPDIAAALGPHVDELKAAGLVVFKSQGGSSLASYLGILRPTHHIFGDGQRAFGFVSGEGAAVRHDTRDLGAVLLAAYKADRGLRVRHISKIVESLQKRKDDRSGNTTPVDELRRQIAIFRKLRPWYPRSYVCLRDSLALLEFLAGRDCFPDLVFGVQVQPFGAHAWLQAGQTVLNDTLEYVGQFTPLMRI